MTPTLRTILGTSLVVLGLLAAFATPVAAIAQPDRPIEPVDVGIGDHQVHLPDGDVVARLTAVPGRYERAGVGATIELTLAIGLGEVRVRSY